MNTNDYAEMGIRFVSEDVRKQHGDHASDRSIVGKGQIAVVEDTDKFRAHFGDGVLLGILDGTSVRVMSQDVSRRTLAKNSSAKPEDIQAAIYNRLKGVRNAGTPSERIVEKKVYTLPNGETYSGSDLVEFQQLYISALMDAGVDSDVALAIGKTQTL